MNTIVGIKSAINANEKAAKAYSLKYLASFGNFLFVQ